MHQCRIHITLYRKSRDLRKSTLLVLSVLMDNISHWFSSQHTCLPKLWLFYKIIQKIRPWLWEPGSAWSSKAATHQSMTVLGSAGLLLDSASCHLCQLHSCNTGPTGPRISCVAQLIFTRKYYFIHNVLHTKGHWSRKPAAQMSHYAPYLGKHHRQVRLLAILALLCKCHDNVGQSLSTSHLMVTTRNCYMSCSRHLSVQQALHCWAWLPELGTAQLRTAQQARSAGELQPWPAGKLERAAPWELWQ